MGEASGAPPVDLLAGAALFLDFDGTLVELAETPDAIRVGDRVPGLLARLAARLGGRLAIVSGRAVADIERHIDCSGIALSGSHGAELRLAGGSAEPLDVPESLAAARAEAAAFVAGAEGLMIEDKPVGIALHYRRAPDQAARVAAFMAGLAERSGLMLQEGKMVAELRPAGADKGAALESLMGRAPFAGARPVFVGDDLTDEHAFEAAEAMAGAGVLVGPERTTAARWRLDDVAATLAWLDRAVEALDG